MLLSALWSKVDGAHLDRELFVEEVGDRAEFRALPRRLVARAHAGARCCRGWPIRPGYRSSSARRPRRWPRPTTSRRTGRSTTYRCWTSWPNCSASHRRRPPHGRAGGPAARADHRPAAHRHLRSQLRSARRLEPVRAGARDADRGGRARPSTTTRSSPRSAGPSADHPPRGAPGGRLDRRATTRTARRPTCRSWPSRCRSPSPRTPPPTDDYAHVILDEAQDLSPMECRMIARRAEYASMTIVGDLGQATHPLAAGSWPELLARLGRRDARTLELRTGYRVPQVIADYAARFLAPAIAADPVVPDRRHAVGAAGRRPAAAVREAVRRRPATRRSRSSRPTTPSTTSRRSSTARRHPAPGQPGQGPGVRPRDRGRAGRHRGRRAPRPQPAVRRADAGRRQPGRPAPPSRCPPRCATDPVSCVRRRPVRPAARRRTADEGLEAGDVGRVRLGGLELASAKTSVFR